MKHRDMTKKRHLSDALRSLHEIAEDLHAVGVIDEATCGAST
jgi:hypothetical protein